VAVVSGPDLGKEICWSEGDIYIGTGQSCDLVLTEPTVSSRHCVIQVGPDGPSVHDLNSTNGTFVGALRVGSAYLRPGSTLRLGRTRIHFDTGPEPRVALSDSRYGLLMGRSLPMRKLFGQMRQVANSAATVLIQGETGTGKELVAETLHMASARRNQPYRVFDCARVTDSLMEPELFGHVRGAFTGAQTSRRGVFETAHTGTVFLDEIGELPLELQPKLLRVLDKRQVTRVGSTRPRRVDVRIIAATNRDLRAAVEEGSFRSDLFYRLHVVSMQLPPLRSRGKDIELLTTHFLRQLSGDPQMETPAELVARLEHHSWPGNVRELRNAVERWLLLADPRRPGTLPLGFANPKSVLRSEESDAEVPFRDAKTRAISEWERDYVSKLMLRHGGNVSKAARAARMNRNHLSELLRRHELGERFE